MIPPALVALGGALWGGAWIYFAYIHKARALYFFSLPILVMAAIYGYYAFVEVQGETRALIARAAILTIALSQSLTLFYLAFFERSTHAD